jgi:hypothetical protein
VESASQARSAGSVDNETSSSSSDIRAISNWRWPAGMAMEE